MMEENGANLADSFRAERARELTHAAVRMILRESHQRPHGVAMLAVCADHCANQHRQCAVEGNRGPLRGVKIISVALDGLMVNALQQLSEQRILVREMFVQQTDGYSRLARDDRNGRPLHAAFAKDCAGGGQQPVDGSLRARASDRGGRNAR
jgi:hypothetical protein